ncbi:MAG: hypothetical protein IJ523_11805 [Succinivibrionaceae bacterium]|nr:hypothetical protein [Succinivibrionaceae bacterium]
MNRTFRILLLSGNPNAGAFGERLSQAGCDVASFHQELAADDLAELKPDLTVSYNYRHIISPRTIEAADGRIVNMHISMLPWNRGASPNLWSIIDNTPRGVTIHRIDAGLDTGEIILQRQLEFDENRETLSSSYDALQKAVTDLFLANLAMFASGIIASRPQPQGGTCHRRKDLLRLLGTEDIDYGMKISEFRHLADEMKRRL